MKKQFLNSLWLCLAIVLNLMSKSTTAATVSGVLTIDSLGTPSATVFRNLSSAITYITSANVRSDGGPSNSAPFGITGTVEIEFTGSITTIIDQVIIPAIPGATATDRLIIRGKGYALRFNCTSTNYSVIRLQGAKHVTIDSLNITFANPTIAWGIHFYQNADSNTVSNCTIDFLGVTTTGTAGTGIVFSNSLTSPTSSGANGRGNTIANNYIKGTPTGAPYYGMTLCPQSSAATFSNNRVWNNVFENIFYSSIYMTNTNSSSIKGNIFNNPNRSTVTTHYTIYMISGAQRDTISNNTFTNPYGGATTTTNTYYGIYPIATNTPNGAENVITNNRFFNINSNGAVYPIFINTASNFRIYNNSISLDQASSTSTQIAAGIYHTGSLSGIGIDVRNNVISVTRGGTGAKYAYYFTTAGTLYNVNNNVVHVSGTNAFVGFYLLNFPTFANWRTANGGIFDAQSINLSPNFVDANNGNLTPQEGFINNKGANLATWVPTDFNGVARTTTPDPGYVEYAPTITLDIGVASIIMPPAPLAAGTQPVNVQIRNSGLNSVTSATINWTLNGVAQTPIAWTGTLAAGDLSANILLGSITLAPGVGYNIAATTAAPNSGVDQNTANDAASLQDIYCVLPGGTYTIDRTAAASSTNFVSMSSFANAISFGGITGPIVANVVANSGPYTEQVFFRAIPGSSSTNNVVINGNGNYVQFNNADLNSIGIINLLGTDNMTFQALNVRSLNVSYGIGYLLTAGADTNVINNCIIDISSVTGGSGSAGIAVTGGLNSATLSAANNGHFNRFTNNTITGGPSGGPYYGISLIPHNTVSSVFSRNVVENNILRDVTVYGMYMSYTSNTIIRGNTVSRPTKTSPTTFYGFYSVNGSTADTFENNIITKPFELLQTSTGTGYGIYITSPNVVSGRPNFVRNNLIYDIKYNGAFYGIFSSSVNHTNFLHNTVIIDHPTASATGLCYAIYHTNAPTNAVYRNNLVYINRGGTGASTAIYLNTVSATGYTLSNNNYFVGTPPGSTNNHIGYYNGAFRTTFADWTTAVTFDLNSTPADPKLRTWLPSNPILPGADSIDNKGFNVLALAPRDITGALRTATPDIGAYEFIVPGADVGITRVVSPSSGVVTLSSLVNFSVRLKNYGKNTLTSADIGWIVDTTLQTPVSWSGTLNPDDTTDQLLGSYFVSTTGVIPVKIWTSNPNSVLDSFPQNDTISMIICTPLSGVVTLNPALPATSTNFTSWASLQTVLSNCGIDGPLTVNIAPGTYNAAIAFNAPIPGVNGTNRITFNGGDSSLVRVVHDATIQRPTLLLNNARNLVFRNIRFETTGSSQGTAVQLINTADSNDFVRCSFIAPYSASTTVNAFVASGSVASPTTLGNSANHLLIDSCTATGGYYAIDLYGTTSPKSINNIVRNSRVINSHFYGIYANYQNGVQIRNNKILDLGIVGNNTAPWGIYVLNSDNGIRVENNEVQNFFGGYGIAMNTNLGTTLNPIVVANNMVNIGDALFTTYGIYEQNNGNIDIAYNAVKLNTAEASFAGAALWSNNNNPSTYQNVKIVNNIFTAPNGCLAVYFVTGANLLPANYTLDYNVYYSTSSFPFRIGGFITNTFTAFVTGTPNMLGTFLPANNQHGQFFMPNFFSATNLRSISPELDDSGTVVTSVAFDVDGKPRNVSTPDIGLIEFSKPAADAGVLSIISPRKPMATGLNDVVVVIKNFGLNNLTTANVSYRIDTTVHTRTYSGLLLPNATDTVRFDSTSGPSGSSQQYNFAGNLVDIKAWTSAPNTVVDSLNLNDTAYVSICGSLSGVYTIDPAGSGPSNFTSFQAAIDKLICGGVAGPVTFNVAPGTYNTQLTIPTIVGANDSTRITFKSANNNASSVTITTSVATPNSNYTIRLLGAQFINIEHMTLTNTNATYSRVIAINKEATSNTNVSNLNVRNCILSGNTIASTADQYALVWGPAGDNATYINFANNTFINGTYGIFLGGQNIVNQNAIGANIDSNTFTNQYYAGIWLTNRFLTNIRGNNITCHPISTNTYGIYIAGFGQTSEISRNRILNPAGIYGLTINQNAYYDAPGLTTVHNNVILMNGNTTQYGIQIGTSNKLRFYNNTVRCNTTSTASYAFFYTGHTSFVNGTTTYPASYDVHVLNNIFVGVNGYAMYTSNVQANAALSNINYNLYHTTSANPMFLGGTNYTPAQFYTTYRNALYAGSENKSLFGPVTFTSPTSGVPTASHPSAWLVNGRGIQLFNMTADFNGNPRSNDVLTGVPDIGAYEIAPTSIPEAATITGTIGFSNVQHIVQYGDTLASLTWGFSGTLPTAITARYYPGSLISHPTLFNMTNLTNRMDMMLSITENTGQFYSYDLKVNYNPIMLGNVVSETDLKMARRDTSSAWFNYAGFLTTTDTINKHFTVIGLPELGQFTGTDDISPLPVQLSSFDVTRSGMDALLTWNTSSEINASHFIVERSVDNRNFTAVARVKATGSTNRMTQYNYADVQVPLNAGARTVYYRLRSVDLDGSSELSLVRRVSFEEVQKGAEPVVYPNPFSNKFSLYINSEMEGTAVVNVFDIFGKLVVSATRNVVAGNNDLTVDNLQSLATGVYMVKVNVNGTEQVVKLIKE